MSTTTTLFVVRREDGHHLGAWSEFPPKGVALEDMPCEYGFVPFPWHDCTFPSRAEAERLAAEHGGTVHRITVTDEAIGPLTWDGSMLMDGDEAIGQAFEAVSGWGRGRFLWFVYRTANGSAATLDEARSQAEAAVRAGWES